MNFDRLERGLEFKNFKELCEFLDMKVKTGKAKQLFMDELSRHCEYRKEGKKIYIYEVLKMPKDKVDKRKDPKKMSNNNKYSKDIQALIISLLASADGHTVYLPVSSMLKTLDMINTNYQDARKHIPKLAEITCVPEAHCHDFFNTNSVKLKEKLETALRGLRNRSLVIARKVTSICILVPDIEVNELGELKIEPSEKKKTSIKYHKEYREATEFEEKVILKIEKMVLLEMGFSTIQDAFLTGRWNEFQRTVNKKLMQKANIEYYYDSYRITYNLDDITKEHLKQLEDDERNAIANNLNSNIKNMVTKYADTRHKRALKKESPNQIEALHATKDYINYSEKLSNVVISKDAKDIRKELKKPVIKSDQITFDDMPF